MWSGFYQVERGFLGMTKTASFDAVKLRHEYTSMYSLF